MIAYCNMVSNWGNPKKRPPTIERYMPLDEGHHSDDFVDERLEALFKAQAAYKEKVKAKNIN